LNAIDVETGKHNNLDPDRDFDVLAFKSNWEWIVDRWARLTFSTSLNVRWQKSVVQVYRDGGFFECTRLVVVLRSQRSRALPNAFCSSQESTIHRET
jgi:hypothetical protein